MPLHEPCCCGAVPFRVSNPVVHGRFVSLDVRERGIRQIFSGTDADQASLLECLFAKPFAKRAEHEEIRERRLSHLFLRTVNIVVAVVLAISEWPMRSSIRG
jgi:hypothetical protein